MNSPANESNHPSQLNILGIDTVTEACSVALRARGEMFEKVEITANAHSQCILGMVESILQAGKIRLGELDALAVDVGPGSFTGVRIGLGVAQGLAYAHDTPVLAVDSTAALAAAVPHPAAVFAAIDARMGQIYYGVYRTATAGGAPQELSPPSLITPQDAAAAHTKIIGVGSGWDQYAPELQTALGAAFSQWIPQQFPRAAAVVQIAAARGLDAAVSPLELRARYVRDEVAAKSTE